MPFQAAGCSHMGDRDMGFSHVPYSTRDWAQASHKCGPSMCRVGHTSTSDEPHSLQQTRSMRGVSWGKRATRQVMISPPSVLR